MKRVLLFLILFFGFECVFASEVNLARNAGSAILVEYSTGKVLYEKNSNVKMAPASMTKVMTLLLSMEALESGRIKLDDKIVVSKNAASMGGTQMFIEEGKEIDVLTVLKGIGIASANDGAVLIGEYIAGTEEAFVSMMNKRAKELGCVNTHFMNPHGLDEEGHYTTAYDMALMARELIKYPLALEITSTYETNIDVSGENHWIVNTNKLIRFYEGMDGLKTGYTDDAKYCLTATMNKNNMRLVSVVMKEETKDNRTNDTVSMMEYGFSNYGIETIVSKDNYEDKMLIDNAKNKEVNYYLDKDINILVDKNTKDINYKIDKELYDVNAPLEKNSKVGKLILSYDNNKYEYDLIIKDDVEKASIFDIFGNLLKDTFRGYKV